MIELIASMRRGEPFYYWDTRRTIEEWLQKRFTVVQTNGYVFAEDQHDFTYVAILGESHFIFHTYREHQLACVNLATCQKYGSVHLLLEVEKLAEMLGAKLLTHRIINRLADVP